MPRSTSGCGSRARTPSTPRMPGSRRASRRSPCARSRGSSIGSRPRRRPRPDPTDGWTTGSSGPTARRCCAGRRCSSPTRPSTRPMASSISTATWATSWLASAPSMRRSRAGRSTPWRPRTRTSTSRMTRWGRGRSSSPRTPLGTPWSSSRTRRTSSGRRPSSACRSGCSRPPPLPERRSLNGEVDWRFPLDAATYDAITDDADLKVVEYPEFSFLGLYFNLHPESGGLFLDRNLRQAVAYCFDKPDDRSDGDRGPWHGDLQRDPADVVGLPDRGAERVSTGPRARPGAHRGVRLEARRRRHLREGRSPPGDGRGRARGVPRPRPLARARRRAGPRVRHRAGL